MAKEQNQTASSAAAATGVPFDVVAALLDKINQIQVSGGGLTAEGLEKILSSQQQVSDKTIQAFTNALIRENLNTPEISVFSFPEGERVRPKARLVDSNGKPREVF